MFTPFDPLLQTYPSARYPIYAAGGKAISSGRI